MDKREAKKPTSFTLDAEVIETIDYLAETTSQSRSGVLKQLVPAKLIIEAGKQFIALATGDPEPGYSHLPGLMVEAFCYQLRTIMDSDYPHSIYLQRIAMTHIWQSSYTEREISLFTVYVKACLGIEGYRFEQVTINTGASPVQHWVVIQEGDDVEDLKKQMEIFLKEREK